jgi:hypothetical protein
LKDTTCQAIGKGNISITLFVLLNKFFSNGLISLATVFESVIDKTGSSKSLKSNIIKGKSEAYLGQLVSSLINKRPLRLRKTNFATLTINRIYEFMKHEILRRSPDSDFDRKLTEMNDAKTLSMRVVDYILPQSKSLSMNIDPSILLKLRLDLYLLL